MPKNSPPVPLSEINQKIEEFLEHLTIEKNCSPLTCRNYKHYLSRFSSWLKDNFSLNSPASIDLEKIKKYRLYLSRYTDKKGVPLARITQGYHVIALRSFLKWLIKNNYKTLSPEQIDLPRGESRSLKFLDSEQIDRLLGQPTISLNRGLRDKAILETLFSTGLRVSELVKLNRDQIDLARREFAVIGKGGRGRVVFLSDRAAAWLNRYLKTRADSWKPLFVRYQGKPDITVDEEKMRLTSRSVQRIVKKYARQARIPIDASPHVIRHSYATDLLRAGADLRSVQELLGHKNISTTQIYTHITNRQLRAVHEKYHGKVLSPSGVE